MYCVSRRYIFKQQRFTKPTLHATYASRGQRFRYYYFFYFHYPALTIELNLFSLFYFIYYYHWMWLYYAYCVSKKKKTLHETYALRTLRFTRLSFRYFAISCLVYINRAGYILFNVFYLLLPLGMIVFCVLCIKIYILKTTLHATYASPGYASDICTILPCL